MHFSPGPEFSFLPVYRPVVWPSQRLDLNNFQIIVRGPTEHEIQVVIPRPVCDALLDYLRRDILNEHHVTACVETVDVVKADQF